MPKQSHTKPVHLPGNQWLKSIDPPFGSLEGKEIGTNCVIIRYSTDEIGKGPNLHVHPYDEIFNILEGRAEFTVGDQTFVAEAGAIVFGPANIPHSYKNIGPGRLDSLDVHLSSEWIQYDLPRDNEEIISGDLT